MLCRFSLNKMKRDIVFAGHFCSTLYEYAMSCIGFMEYYELCHRSTLTSHTAIIFFWCFSAVDFIKINHISAPFHASNLLFPIGLQLKNDKKSLFSPLRLLISTPFPYCSVLFILLIFPETLTQIDILSKLNAFPYGEIALIELSLCASIRLSLLVNLFVFRFQTR